MKLHLVRTTGETFKGATLHFMILKEKNSLPLVQLELITPVCSFSSSVVLEAICLVDGVT